MCSDMQQPKVVQRSEAIQRGLPRYFSGKPCKNGHISERYTSGGCIECILGRNKAAKIKNPELVASNNKKWRENNPEKVARYGRSYREKNKEKHALRRKEDYLKNRDRQLAQSKLWQSKNKDRCREKQREWCDRNRDKVNKTARNWSAKNRDYQKLYREENKTKINERNKRWKACNRDKINSYTRNRRAKQRESKGTHSDYDIQILLELQNGECAYCKVKVGDNYHVDHITPVSKGGSNSRENLQICCPTCNLRKSNKDPIDFARELAFPQ